MASSRSRRDGGLRSRSTRDEPAVEESDSSDGLTSSSEECVAPARLAATRRRPGAPRVASREPSGAGAGVPRKRRRVGAAPTADAGDAGDGGGVDDGPMPLSLSQASTGSTGDSVALDIRPMAHGKRRAAGGGGGGAGRSRSSAATTAAAGSARPAERRLQEMDMANLMTAFKEKYPPPKSHLASLGGTFAVRVRGGAGQFVGRWFWGWCGEIGGSMRPPCR